MIDRREENALRWLLTCCPGPWSWHRCASSPCRASHAQCLPCLSLQPPPGSAAAQHSIIIPYNNRAQKTELGYHTPGQQLQVNASIQILTIFSQSNTARTYLYDCMSGCVYLHASHLISLCLASSALRPEGAYLLIAPHSLPAST